MFHGFDFGVVFWFIFRREDLEYGSAGGVVFDPDTDAVNAVMLYTYDNFSGFFRHKLGGVFDDIIDDPCEIKGSV